MRPSVPAPPSEMDPAPRPLRAADLRQRLDELAAELLKTEEALVALESDGQLKLNAATALATTRTLPPALRAVRSASLRKPLRGSNRALDEERRIVWRAILRYSWPFFYKYGTQNMRYSCSPA